MVRGIFLFYATLLAAQNAAVRDAATALQHADFAAAAKLLRPEAAAHPDDAWTLSLLAYTLDNQHHSQEAEDFHQRAVTLAPNSAEILNNFGTHLWLLERYPEAEAIFTRALAAAPTYFNVLYNLGVMATNAGHLDRAREVLQTALRQQPKNVDVLYRLATAEELSKHWDTAAEHLAQAAQLAPNRADIQKLLAFTATELGALADAAAAWDRYLALEPADDTAHRERAYTAVKLGKLEAGIAGLEAFLARHPDDKTGHYELAQAERSLDASKAFQHFDRALTLDPNYAAARAARGSLQYQNGNFEAALTDLEAASALDPADAANLDRLGQTYQSLDRPADAVRVLRKAADATPTDSKILLHLGRALADAGQTAESKSVMQRFRELGPEQKNIVPEGLVSYLGLTPEQRRKDYRARLENVTREHPDDASAQLEYLKFLLEEHDAKLATAVARRIAALKPAAELLAGAGQALLNAKYPQAAKDLLEQGTSAGANVPLPLAQATYQAAPSAATAKTALTLLDRIPESQQTGDYHLARAQMLEAAGRPHEVEAALNRAAQASPDLCLRAAAFLISKGRAPEAFTLLDASRENENREILLMRATTLERLNRTAEANALLKRLQSQWPEWPAAWAAEGIILAAHQRYAEALAALQAATALSPHDPDTEYFLTKAREKQAPDAAHLSRFFEGSLLIR